MTLQGGHHHKNVTFQAISIHHRLEDESRGMHIIVCLFFFLLAKVLSYNFLKDDRSFVVLVLLVYIKCKIPLLFSSSFFFFFPF